jgi:hypothetical protein
VPFGDASEAEAVVEPPLTPLAAIPPRVGVVGEVAEAAAAACMALPANRLTTDPVPAAELVAAAVVEGVGAPEAVVGFLSC